MCTLPVDLLKLVLGAFGRDLVHEDRARGLAVPAAIAACSDHVPPSGVDNCAPEHRRVSPRRRPRRRRMNLRIWETNPPWCPGMILNWTPLRGFMDPSGSPVSATFHRRMLSVDALAVPLAHGPCTRAAKGTLTRRCALSQGTPRRRRRRPSSADCESSSRYGAPAATNPSAERRIPPQSRCDAQRRPDCRPRTRSPA